MHHCAAGHCKRRVDIPSRFELVVVVDQVVHIVRQVPVLDCQLEHEVKLGLGVVQKCRRHRVVAVR